MCNTSPVLSPITKYKPPSSHLCQSVHSFQRGRFESWIELIWAAIPNSELVTRCIISNANESRSGWMWSTGFNSPNVSNGSGATQREHNRHSSELKRSVKGQVGLNAMFSEHVHSWRGNLICFIPSRGHIVFQHVEANANCRPWEPPLGNVIWIRLREAVTSDNQVYLNEQFDCLATTTCCKSNFKALCQMGREMPGITW